MLSQCDLVEHWYKKIDGFSIQEQIDVVDSMSALLNTESIAVKKQTISLISVIRNAVLVKQVIDLLLLVGRYIT